VTAFAELVPPPDRGRVYSETFRGGLADAGPAGRVRLDALARWMQDVAYGDVEEAGAAGEGLWLVRRARLLVERAPAFREAVEARTWCSGLGRVWAERRTELRGDDGARADATALWVFVDPATSRPRSIGDVMKRGYAAAAAGRRVTARLRHPEPPDDAAGEPWRFRAADLDLADHVNNTAAWAAVEELLAAGGRQGGERLDVEVEYRAPAGAGEGRLLRAPDGGALWLVGPDGQLHASALVRRPRA
jgi:acyl-ACP thioesterase